MLNFTNLNQFLENIKSCQNLNQKIETDFIEIQNLIPKEYQNYYTYSGSLTTPPYTENVTWIVFKNPVNVSSEFLNHLRSLKTKNEKFLVSNFRNIMPLCKRKIYRTFYHE